MSVEMQLRLGWSVQSNADIVHNPTYETQALDELISYEPGFERCAHCMHVDHTVMQLGLARMSDKTYDWSC